MAAVQITPVDPADREALLAWNAVLRDGVRPDLIRISVGLEDVEDILWDLDQAITGATGRSREEQV